MYVTDIHKRRKCENLFALIFRVGVNFRRLYGIQGHCLVMGSTVKFDGNDDNNVDDKERNDDNDNDTS